MPAGSPRSGRGRTAFIVTAAVIVAVVVAAWVLQATTDKGDEPLDGSSPRYAVAVRQGGEVLKEYDLAALRALPQTSVVIDGKEQDGPLLRSVLDDAGADPGASADVVGAGIRDEGRLRLTAAQVDDGVLLDFSDRGTAKVCSPWLDRADWVRDVISIDVP